MVKVKKTRFLYAVSENKNTSFLMVVFVKIRHEYGLKFFTYRKQGANLELRNFTFQIRTINGCITTGDLSLRKFKLLKRSLSEPGMNTNLLSFSPVC